MSIKDVFQVNKIKTDLEKAQKENDELRKSLAETDKMNYADLKKAIENLTTAKNELSCF